MFQDQRYQKKNKRIKIAVMLFASLLFIFSGISSPMLANEDTPSETAITQNKEAVDSKDKCEVIYAKLNDTGGVSEVYIVNRFKPFGDAPLKDYGTYSDTKPLTDTGSVKQEGDHLIIETGESDFYYQGKLKSNTLPWRFVLSYHLDGQRVKPADLSGATGQLEIDIEVATNPQLSDEKNGINPWAKNDLLQLSLTIPDEVCDELKVEGGSIAQAGSNQLATFLVFPGSDSTRFKVRADVRDFYMPAMQIAGLPMNMDISVDDFLALSDDEDLKALQEGVAQLHEGSLALADGLFELKKGGEELQSGLNDLARGGAELSEGGDKLAGGINQYIDGVKELLDGISQTYQGSEKLVAAADEFAKGFEQLDATQLLQSSAQIRAALEQIAAGLEALGSAEDIETLKAQLLNLEQAASALSQGSTNFKNALGELNNGVTGLSALAQGLYNGLGAVITEMESQEDAPTNRAAIIQEAGLSDGAADNEDVQLLLDYMIAKNETQNNNKAQNLQSLYALYNAPTSPVTAKNLKDGLGALSENMATLQTNYETFDANIQAFATMIPGLANMVGLVDLAGGLKSLAEQYALFDEGLQAYVGGVTAIREAFKSTQGQPDLYSGIVGLRDGLKQLNSGGRLLSENSSELKKGLNDFVNGVKKFVGGVDQLKEGFAQYLCGVAQSADGSAQLADGLGELYNGVSNIDEQLKEKIDELMGQYQFDNQQTVSFASERNQNVDQVQFVMMTEAIPEKESPKAPIQEPEKTNLWDRFVNLFR